MRIGIYFNDKGFCDIYFTKITEGNPGVGGTHYEFALLFTYLSDIYDVTVFHHNHNILSDKCEDIITNTFEEAVAASKRLDLLIFQANIVDAVQIVERYEVDSIAWAHNNLSFKRLNELAYSRYVIKIVCVGKQLYRLTRLRTNKAVLIYNMISPVLFNPNPIRRNVLTYIGSVVPAKGLHMLAEIWPDIYRLYPDAELYIIGSGSLYNRNAEMGKYGIAQRDYEDVLINYLSEGKGTIPSNVHFLGNLGEEKKEIIKQTTIGIVNPSGRTETFGISALDFNCGGVIAIGNMPSIRNGINGYNVHSKRALKKRIISCLNNRALTKEMETTCHEWVKNRFFPDVIILQWKRLIDSIDI